jgi:SAM-dependent methyltransferase
MSAGRARRPTWRGLAGEQLGLRGGELVLDYGCGIGRLARALIERYDVRVIGVDISPEMRAMAPPYVDSSSFSAVSRRVLQAMASSGFRADAALSVWVLQHCADPGEDIDLLAGSLRPGAPLLVVNTVRRAVPTKEIPWADDGRDVRAELARRLKPVREGRLDPQVVTAHAADHTFWATYGVGARSGLIEPGKDHHHHPVTAGVR